MNFVRFALQRPYTFFVAGIAIVLLGVAAIRSTPTDVFPNIDIPVVTVVWDYQGLTGEEMEQRFTTYSEFSISFFVDNIRNIESQTIPGTVVEKIYFQPNVNLDLAISQIVSATNSIRAFMPPGTQPPIIMQFSASTVPVLQLSLSSETLSETALYDYGVYRVRQQLAPIQGVTLPSPYGGKRRQIMIDMDQAALTARGMTPTDVTKAINAQSLTLPTGGLKLGNKQYETRVNAMPETVRRLNAIPIRAIDGAIVKVGDVATVRDGAAVQTNVVRTEGRRSVLLTIFKRGEASTLDVVDRIRNEVLPLTRAAAPAGMKIEEFFDQSLFVRGAIKGVVTEAVIAACLTALMILVFLGSWRSTLIVAVSIPLSILVSIAILSAMGHTLNVMTLGGLALAVGILVDDATVTIENIHRLRQEGRPLNVATLHGAAGIALPTLVSTLAISAVFVSVEFLTGPPKFLFTPLGLAVVFAMLASYAISRTLVPILAGMLLKGEARAEARERERGPGRFRRGVLAFERGFERLREGYGAALAPIVAGRFGVPVVSLAMLALAAFLFPRTGQDFFPAIDSGTFKLHIRAPSGTRIETTEQYFDGVEDIVRRIIPEDERRLILDNIGEPFRYNFPFDDGSTVGKFDGQVLVSLNERHGPTAAYVKRLRDEIAKAYPELVVYAQPGDIVSQILNFGIPAPIDVQVVGYDKVKNLRIAQAILAEMRAIPGLADAHLHQVVDQPRFLVNVDRDRAQDLGLTAQDVASSVGIALASGLTVNPNYWTDPATGIIYPITPQAPEYRVASMDDLKNILVGVRTEADETRVPTLFGNVASFRRAGAQSVTNHSNIQPTYDIYANPEGRDLGGLARAIDAIVARHTGELSPGNTIEVRGQIESMRSAFQRLGVGLAAAAVVVYLLMVVNFQSWSDPLVVALGLPGAMCGIVLMLYATGTSLSVPALMGAIMSVGVASANSILLITFAKESRAGGLSAAEAAVLAGRTRLRPILMTALAMLVGMLPMSLGLGEGGEQNAPLGRAVIGGLLIATATTLFVVPWLYARLRRHEPAPNTEYDDV